MCLGAKVLASLQVILNFFFLKKWVGRAMGNQAFYGDGLIETPFSRFVKRAVELILNRM